MSRKPYYLDNQEIFADDIHLVLQSYIDKLDRNLKASVQLLPPAAYSASVFRNILDTKREDTKKKDGSDDALKLDRNAKLALWPLMIDTRASEGPHDKPNHFVLLAYYKDSNVVVYQDPLGHPIPADIKTSIQARFPDVNIVDVGKKQQSNSYDCGPIVIEDAYQLMTHFTDPRTDKDYNEVDFNRIFPDEEDFSPNAMRGYVNRVLAENGRKQTEDYTQPNHSDTPQLYGVETFFNANPELKSQDKDLSQFIAEVSKETTEIDAEQALDANSNDNQIATAAEQAEPQQLAAKVNSTISRLEEQGQQFVNQYLDRQPAGVDCRLVESYLNETITKIIELREKLEKTRQFVNNKSAFFAKPAMPDATASLQTESPKAR